ncbi:pilus assembly protein [Mesorhizobium sp. ASY16-5R]|uniref:pilus assembly protein n=1 Tax=Mesorhizobium sp. ASY16-5R TaxID=3445772 RepID=UPI003F9F4AB1
MFKRFLRSTSGNFAMMFAIASPAVLFAVGFGIDVTNLMSAKSDLQASLDAAVMAASRLGAANISRKDKFDAYFSSNVADKNLLRDPTATLAVNETLVDIRNVGTATSHVDLKFMGLFGADPLIKVTAVAYESRRNVEVALVLDNTGSMIDTNKKLNRIWDLREAATELVKTLKGMQGSGTSGRTVRAALVPFVTAVNVKGKDFKESWIDMTGKNKQNGVHFNKINDAPAHHKLMFDRLGEVWRGCVEARPDPYNLSDVAPDINNPSTLFVPYFAPDEPGGEKAPGNDANNFNNSYLKDDAPATASTDPGTVEKQSKEQRRFEKYNARSGGTIRKISEDRALPPTRKDAEVQAFTNGPNRACPTPIVPLTEDLDSLQVEIGKMRAWAGSGTNVSEGLAWGRRVLSPEEPYTEAQPFTDEHVSKWVVVFTDGTNEVFGSANSFNGSDYGAYGFLSDRRMSSSGKKSDAITQVNTWTSTMCTELKKQDVQIFTILLGSDNATNRKLYGDCASKPEYYFGTNDPAKLKTIFSSIASIIASLQFTG